jgi:hypothetical protein
MDRKRTQKKSSELKLKGKRHMGLLRNRWFEEVITRFQEERT